MKTLPIYLPRAEIEQFCQRNCIRKLSLFGSVLRDDFTAQSDVDVLVEFAFGKTPGWSIVTMENELSHLLGRMVDLRTPAELSRYFRSAVLQEAMVIYDQN
ncbi:MAG: nucleotidyltransferase family protein [Cyanobacteriota bacterium]|nr:nucleotidyltransferase family protein [Cyanobacteriota bacterium]